MSEISPVLYNNSRSFNVSSSYAVKSTIIKLSTDFKGWKDGDYDKDLRNPSSVQYFNNRESTRGLHPTQKPVALLEYLVKTYSQEGETVLDFTMGSGSTGVACLNTNRKFVGVELDKQYFDIAINRMVNN